MISMRFSKPTLATLLLGIALPVLAAAEQPEQYDMVFRMNGLDPSFMQQRRADQAMCETQEKWEEQEVRTRTAYRKETQTVNEPIRYNYGSSPRYYWAQSGGQATSHHVWYDTYRCTPSSYSATTCTNGGVTFRRGTQRATATQLALYSVSITRQETVQVPYQQEYLETVTRQSERYDWCKSAGYATGN